MQIDARGKACPQPVILAKKEIDGGCRDDNTGRTEVGLGDGTSWVLDAHAGRYCLSLYKLDHRDADAWTTLTVVRP